MYLHKQDVKDLQELFDKFPNIETIQVEQETGSGIGSVTTATIETEINGFYGKFTVEISGVENW